MNHIKIKYFAFLLGFIAIVVQIILLRSFLAVFYGTELSIGLLLAFWLLWNATGSWFGNHLNRHHVQRLWQILAFALYASLTWAAVILVANKWIRWVLSVPSGEFITTHQFLLFAAPILAPVCFLLGLCFTCLAQLFHIAAKGQSSPASTIYIFEAIGSAAGSMLFTFLLVKFLSPLQTICLLWCCLSLLTAFFVRNMRKFAIIMAAIAVMIVFFVISIEQRLTAAYWKSQSPHMRLIENKTTRYGEVAVVEWGGEKVLYANSLKQTVLPDAITAQAQAALALYQHKNANKFLLIEGGLSGLAPELASYPGAQVDYVVMDGEAHELAMRHLSTQARQHWQQPNLSIFHEDGRRFLSRTLAKYDVILLSVGRPVSAFSNRYYTEEFFAMVVEKLEPDGLFGILGFPSAENYLGKELLELNAALYHGLKKYFASVLIIPGDQAIFLAALQEGNLTTNPEELSQRMQDSGRVSSYFYPQMFAQYLPADRVAFITTQLQSFQPHRANRDFQPIVYYIDLVLWHKMTQRATKLLQLLAQIPFTRFVLIYVWVLCLLSVLLLLKKRKRDRQVLIWNSAFIGFTGITLNVLFVLAMQNIFGYVYEGMGLAMAAFMFGMGLASAFSRHYLQKNTLLFLRGILLLLILFCITLLYTLQYLQRIYSMILFFLAVFLSGTLSGAGFPLLFQQYDQATTKRRYGSIYAADLAGSALGSIMISAIAVPLWGFAKSALLPALGCGIGLMMSLTIKNLNHIETRGMFPCE